MSYAANQVNALETAKLNNPLSADSDFILAIQDVFKGLTNYKLWSYMAQVEIRRRYRRTLIGPFWTTLSLGIFIGCTGSLLSILWKMDPKEFLAYFSAGYIIWTLIQTIISESCNNFIAAGPFIRQVQIPYTTYACIVTWRNLIVFAHHLVIMLLVILYSQIKINLNMLWMLPGLALIFFTGTWIGVFLGMVCARYRDIQQLVNSILQLAMFVTPIMWRPEQMGNKVRFVTTFNPAHHFISIIRQPLLGLSPSVNNWLFAIGFSVVGATITFLLFAKNYRKLVFWV